MQVNNVKSISLRRKNLCRNYNVICIVALFLDVDIDVA